MCEGAGCWNGISVHPRACGEHGCIRHTGHGNNGSSPRLRGTYAQHVEGVAAYRFIPALAGNMQCCACNTDLWPVHPRACGEHEILRKGRREVLWFIPALAGNMCYHHTRNPERSVHPRACGEHDRRDGVTILNAGSSPRLRGTCCITLTGSSINRFIPALAGNMIESVIRLTPVAVHPRACGEHAESMM